MPSAASMTLSPSGSAIFSAIAAFAPSTSRPHLAAEEVLRRQTAEHHIGVRDRRLGTAIAIADRARSSARTFGTDAHRGTRDDACDTAASGADLRDVDHRNLNRQALVVAADHDVSCRHFHAVEDHAGLGGGAAHVEGDRVLHADRRA